MDALVSNCPWGVLVVLYTRYLLKLRMIVVLIIMSFTYPWAICFGLGWGWSVVVAVFDGYLNYLEINFSGEVRFLYTNPLLWTRYCLIWPHCQLTRYSALSWSLKWWSDFDPSIPIGTLSLITLIQFVNSRCQPSNLALIMIVSQLSQCLDKTVSNWVEVPTYVMILYRRKSPTIPRYNLFLVVLLPPIKRMVLWTLD